MKRVVTALVFLLAISCKENKQNVNSNANTSNDVKKTEIQIPEIAEVSFSDEMTEKIFRGYQELRTALVASEVSEAQTAAKKLAEGFTEKQKGMKTMVLAMANTDELEKQRDLFSIFTDRVEPLFKESISEGSIYKQFCPMAFKGKGGYWISDVAEIMNPYFGDKMLNCGEVAEKIQ